MHNRHLFKRKLIRTVRGNSSIYNMTLQVDIIICDLKYDQSRPVPDSHGHHHLQYQPLTGTLGH